MTLISTLEPILRDLGSVKAAAGAAIAPRVYVRHARSAGGREGVVVIRRTQSVPSISISILDAIDAPSIWAGWFRHPQTWAPWRAFLSVMFGLPLDPAGLELFRQCTARNHPTAGGYTEAWLIIGRRGGKSFILALIACFLAVFKDWRPYLSPGEVGTVKVIAVDRKQARVIHRYCRALLRQVPAFTSLINRETDDEIALTNRITIEVQTASFRSTRGYTCIAALCDEIAYWRSDETASNPDSEILRALRPAMATIPNALLLCASSPYARRGELYNAYRRHHGQESPVLSWRAATRTMNSTVPQSFIDDQVERDPSGAAAEYLAEFRSDIESFINREVVDAAVVPGRHELPKLSNTTYRAFVDPSGGSADSMTLGIAHRDSNGNAILDLLRERRPPFSPEQVASEFAVILKAYNIRRVTGDHYAGEWPREQFRKAGIQYDTSDRSKSEIYLESLPLLNSGKIELLDHLRLITQLCGLERRTPRSGRDSIDHGPGAHDDLCNVALGALLLVSRATAKLILSQPALQKLASMPPRDRFTPRRIGLDRRSGPRMYF